MRRHQTLPVALVVIALAAGCGATPWNDLNRGIEVAAAGARVLDEQVAEAMVEPHRQAREAAIAEARARPELSAEEVFARVYLPLVQPWEDLTLALEAFRVALVLGRDVAAAWRDSRRLPDDPQPFCRDLGVATAHLLEGLAAVGLDVPGWLTGLPVVVTPVCGAVVAEVR